MRGVIIGRLKFSLCQLLSQRLLLIIITAAEKMLSRNFVELFYYIQNCHQNIFTMDGYNYNNNLWQLSGVSIVSSKT